jgi:hypothetical protein
MHRSYSAPDDEYQQNLNYTNNNSQYYDLHNNYYYNNLPSQAYNQQYLPSVQPVLYDNPYYAGNNYKSKTRLRKNNDEPVLKNALSAESLFGPKNNNLFRKHSSKHNNQEYLNYVYEKNVGKKKKVPIKKELVVNTEKKVAAKCVIVDDDDAISSSSWSSADKKVLKKESQKNVKNAQNKQNCVYFIPPDPEKLLRPTLRGAPTGFLSSTHIPPAAKATAPTELFVKKSEVDKLREEVDDLEKQLSDLKKAFTSSKSNSSENGSSHSLNVKSHTEPAAEAKSLEEGSMANDTQDDDESYSEISNDVDESSSSRSSSPNTTSFSTEPTAPQTKPQVIETTYFQANAKQAKNLWAQSGQNNQNPFQQQQQQQQQSYARYEYDYYEIDPQSDYARRSNHRLQVNDYNNLAYRNDVYGNHHHQHHLQPKQQQQQTQSPYHKYNYYNYQSNYNKYADYQRNDYSQVI